MTRLCLVVLFAGCAAERAPAAPTSQPEPRAARAAPALVASTAPVEAPEPALAERDLGPFERVLEARVHSIAFGKGASVAALGEAAYIERGKGFSELPKLPRPSAHVSIYFGRDDQPRAMGFEEQNGEKLPVYLRFRAGAWQNGAAEIAKLGSPAPGALFGVLGWDDPEVVCKERELCIIKRLSGWTMIPVLELSPVVLCGGEAFAYSGEKLWKLAAKSFEPYGAQPTFRRADAVWRTPDDSVWVIEHGASAIHRHDGKSWSRQASPIAGPRSVWASGTDDLFVAGDGGLAHFDGKSWARVEGASEGLTLVTGRAGGEPWLAARSGVYRLKRM